MEIERHILILIENLRHIDSTTHLNERYLHHLFSRQIQNDYPIELNCESQLHPEWATSIKDKRKGGIYKKVGNSYEIVESDGSPGFIDFAIGNAENPDCAIEFKMSTHFNKEGLIYDYMKLLDGRNHFDRALSVAVYYGHSSHSKLCEAKELNTCLRKAIDRLKGVESDRPFKLFFLEIIDGRVVKRLECSNNREFAEINC